MKKEPSRNFWMVRVDSYLLVKLIDDLFRRLDLTVSAKWHAAKQEE